MDRCNKCDAEFDGTSTGFRDFCLCDNCAIDMAVIAIDRLRYGTGYQLIKAEYHKPENVTATEFPHTTISHWT